MSRSASLRLALAASLVAASATAAQAQTRTWTFSDNTAPGSCGQAMAGGTNNVGNVWGCSAQPSGTTTSLYTAAYSTSDLTSAGVITAAAITPQGSLGIGVGSAAEGGSGSTSTSGIHAFDNNASPSPSQGGADLLLLQFVGGPQALTQLTLGWTNNDADFQVLRWAGAGLPGGSATVGAALAAGWELVSTVGGANPGAYAVNGNRLASSYWLVSAYNPGWGTTGGTFSPNFVADQSADRFKLQGVTAAVVPEPSTYALMATGLAGLLAAARRRRAA